MSRNMLSYNPVVKYLISEHIPKSFKAYIRRPKVSDSEIAFALLELSTLLESGLNLIKALEVISSETENAGLREALRRLKESVERGESISGAFSSAGIFPEFLLEMLKTAERGENLEKVLRIAGEYMQRTEDTKNKLLTTLAYPLFVIFSSLLAVLVVVKVVVPKIASVLQGLGKDLPLITKMLVLFANLLGYLLYLLPIFLLLFFLRHRLIKRELWDRFLLRLPVFGRLSLYYNLSRFASTLHMALSSNIPIARAISLSVGSISNAYLRTSLRGIDQEVAKGRSLSSVLREKRVLPETFLNLLAMGERSGELEKSLKMLSELYERQADRVISFWLRFAEPLAMLVVGALVAVVVLSVVLPLSEISAGVRR